LEPGTRYEVEVELDVLGQAVAVGDRLRLAISTTYWPWLWPSPDEAEITIVVGDVSWIDLPVRSAADVRPPPGFGPPRSEPTLPIDELEATEPFRTLDHDARTGTHTLSLDPEGDRRYRLPDGLEITERTRDRFTIREGDPLSARVECDRLLGLERGAWRIEVRTNSVMTGDREAFHLVDSVQAFEGTELVFERIWERSIPRDHV
ncbi:MAG TPA: CocE/NonD family hydrolase C-terminal non-catalytic domain-containing protein, partial [Actinomycetota bacterium]|nr:CocE/NonD family hydrolase C-terminal non-catalytic domain-containing protein [Actinomycetota bacterium]